MPKEESRARGGAHSEDLRRLRETLLQQEAQFAVRLNGMPEGPAFHALERQRTELRALRELFEAVMGQASGHRADERTRGRPVTLPSRPAMLLDASWRPARPQARADHTILVVDDHPPTLYAATRLLKKAGYGVMEATSGEQALLLCERASALLLDVNLPDTNGVAVCQVVKRSSAKPVVLMSAVYSDELHQSAGLSAGADLYLTTLLDGQQLANAFDKLLAATAA